MTGRIDAFGGDGAHEIHFGTGEHDHTQWLTRDLWFDRDIDGKWIVWAQSKLPASQDAVDDEDSDIGSIIVTHPAVIAFIDQLGALLVDPGKFSHEPRFDEASVDAS